MKKNVSQTDRYVRMAVGAAILLLGLLLGSWWGLIGLVPLATGALSYCPLYQLLGFSTVKAPRKPSWSKRSG